MKNPFIKMLAFLSAAILFAMGSAFATEDLRADADNFFANPDEAYGKLVSQVERASHSNSFKGSVLIATEDEIILFGGVNTMTTEGTPADLHTTYNIGSCSKVFTAVAIFQLIEAGQISLEDPVSRFFPEYETGKGITIRHLLHMQSGIPDYVNNPSGFWVRIGRDRMDEFLLRSYRDEVTDEEFLENLYAAPLDFEPGTRQEYSNTNYHILAMITEQVSGTRLCDYLQEHIFDPCGMKHTTAMVAGNETSVPVAFWDLLSMGIVDENGYTMQSNYDRGAGGVHTCLADLWAFDKALLSCQLTSESSFGEMTCFDMDYGCGLYPYGKNAYGHSGKDGTYTTQNVIIESEQFGRIYFIVSSATDAGEYGLSAILQAAFGVTGKQ